MIVVYRINEIYSVCGYLGYMEILVQPAIRKLISLMLVFLIINNSIR